MENNQGRRTLSHWEASQNASGFAAAFTGSLALGTAVPASAQRFYFNAPGIHIDVGRPHYRNYYQPYRPGYYDYYAGDDCYAAGCCPRHFTIQDGVCKPYRGY